MDSIGNFSVPEENRKKYLSEIHSLLKTFEKQEEHIVVTDTNSNQKKLLKVPSYLFRGEAKLYGSTPATMDRLLDEKNTEFNDTEKHHLENLSKYVNGKLLSCLNQDIGLSTSYVQHYGLYTLLLDFTSCADVCAAFSTNTENRNGPGRVCVAKTKTLSENAVVIDLTSHPYAERPRRQKAYAVNSKSHINFKSNQCIEHLDLDWYEFEYNDIPEILDELELYKTSDDKVAGFITIFIDEYIRENGKIPHRLAVYLANKIKRVPLFGITNASISGELTGRLVSADEMNVIINQKDEMEYSISMWSNEINIKPDPIQYQSRGTQGSIRILRSDNLDFYLGKQLSPQNL